MGWEYDTISIYYVPSISDSADRMGNWIKQLTRI